jgi:hypothetical protein
MVRFVSKQAAAHADERFCSAGAPPAGKRTSAVGTPPLQQPPVLEVPNFRGRRIVLVIRAVKICHRRVDELININAIQAIDANGMKLSAERRILSPREGTDPAVFAKYVMNAVRLVVDQFSFAREKPKRVRP